jgi:hypothetical protein
MFQAARKKSGLVQELFFKGGDFFG